MSGRLAIVALLLGACGPDEETPTVDPGAPADELLLPDIDGVDMGAAFLAALDLAAGVHTGAVWGGHTDALALRQAGCPDLYLGSADDDLEDTVSWRDECSTAGGLFWSGGLSWVTEHASDGDPEDAAGETTDAARTLLGDGAIGDADGVRFAFDGSATDALYQVEAKGYSTWTWSSLVEGTAEGRDLFGGEGAATPDGWRADLYLHAAGGDAQSLTLRGDVFLFDGHLADRFDSVSMDLDLAGPGASAPGDCDAEPDGYIGLRDTDAYWYDLVFQPRYGDDAEDEYTNEPYSGCDGCGTLYLRGVASGEICLDLSGLWDGDIQPPSPEDYALSLRDLTGSE